MNRIGVGALVLAIFAMPVGALADGGVAYESVNRIVFNADPSTMQPGSFDRDYATASASQPAPSTGGGLFGKFKQAISMGENAGAMLRNGMAQRHYVAGSKSRTDMTALGMAFITDCSARTITVLNLNDKTYRVESMDHPSAATGNATGTTGGSAKDDGTKVAIAVQNRSLGSAMLGGQSANGYRSTMSFTETKPGAQPQTQHMDMIAYYSSMHMPHSNCSRFGGSGGMSPGEGMAMMAAGTRVMQALAASGIDKRFSLSQSGPPLPAGNLAMYEAIFFGDKGTAFVNEIGNVRPIDANDPVFSVPPGFTKQ
jgi:hypothetical protein